MPVAHRNIRGHEPDCGRFQISRAEPFEQSWGDDQDRAVILFDTEGLDQGQILAVKT